MRRAAPAGLTRLRDAVGREDGQALSEYGLILVLISIAAVTVMETIGLDLLAVFNDAADSVAEAVD